MTQDSPQKPEMKPTAPAAGSDDAKTRRPGKPSGSRPMHGKPVPMDDLIPDLASLAPLEPTAEFLAAVAEVGIEFDAGELHRLGQYLAMLLATNERFNLTAITDPAQAWMRHIYDALTLMPALHSLREEQQENDTSPSKKMKVIDVGSGGGVPGIPLAIALPDDFFTLLEPTGKKAEFLRRAIAAIGITNAGVVCARAEVAAQDPKVYREKFDAAVVRAVGRLVEIAELCVGFVKPPGVILAIKGEKADEEVAEASKAFASLKLEHADTFVSKTGRVVILTKLDVTPRMYPRADGEPKRRPLGLPAPQRARKR